MNCGFWNYRVELLLCGDINASLRDPIRLETAGRANVEVRAEVIDVGLERVPAGMGGVKRRKEETGAAEVVGLDETESLVDELAWSGVEGGRFCAAA